MIPINMHTGFKDTCEEVSFKVSFEGREGRAVAESEGKRIPDLCSREAEGTTTMLFSFEGGDSKHLSSKGEHRRCTSG